MEAPEGYVCALLQFEKLCKDTAIGHAQQAQVVELKQRPNRKDTWCFKCNVKVIKRAGLCNASVAKGRPARLLGCSAAQNYFAPPKPTPRVPLATTSKAAAYTRGMYAEYVPSARKYKNSSVVVRFYVNFASPKPSLDIRSDDLVVNLRV